MFGGTLIIQNSKLAKQRPICQNSSKNMNIVRVVVVEDHDLTRMGLVAALQHREGIQVVGEAISGLQGLKLLEEAK